MKNTCNWISQWPPYSLKLGWIHLLGPTIGPCLRTICNIEHNKKYINWKNSLIEIFCHIPFPRPNRSTLTLDLENTLDEHAMCYFSTVDTLIVWLTLELKQCSSYFFFLEIQQQSLLQDSSSWKSRTEAILNGWKSLQKHQLEAEELSRNCRLSP